MASTIMPRDGWFIDPEKDDTRPLIEHEQLCTCQPLGAAEPALRSGGQDEERQVLISPDLGQRLYRMLSELEASGQSFSVLLLHIAQLEQHYMLDDNNELVHQRRRYHALPELLEQVLVNVRRVVRSADQVLVDAGIGAAIILPSVDRWGIRVIVERVYNSIGLLQAETVIPPLSNDTEIVLGAGSYPASHASMVQFLKQVSVATRSFMLRPAITGQMPVLSPSRETAPLPVIHDGEHSSDIAAAAPFMELPARIPQRLKHLLPYDVALQVRCVPVGREQKCLTVAMAQPRDVESVRLLQRIAGMSIFPVTCREMDLYRLLRKKW